MDRHRLVAHQRPVAAVGHETCGVGEETREEGAEEAGGEVDRITTACCDVVGGVIGGGEEGLAQRKQLFAHVHHRLHGSVADEAFLAPGFSVRVLGCVGLDRREEGQVVSFSSVEFAARGFGFFFLFFRRGVEEDVLDAEGGDDVDGFGEAVELGL